MIEDHKIKGVAFKQTPNISAGLIVPQYLVIHYSASGDTAGTVHDLRNASVKNRRSAHLVIGRDGEVIQLARFNQRAWHCGKSAWENLVDGNDWSIGIELVNLGRLKRSRDGKYLAWTKQEVPTSEVIQAKHKNETALSFWHTYTTQQIARCKDIAAELVREYGLKDVIGHDDIAPTRKPDPGPAFPMAELRAYCSPVPVPMRHENRAMLLQLWDDKIHVTMSDDTGEEVTDVMTATEARALKDWLGQILPREVI